MLGKLIKMLPDRNHRIRITSPECRTLSSRPPKFNSGLLVWLKRTFTLFFLIDCLAEPLFVRILTISIEREVNEKPLLVLFCAISCFCLIDRNLIKSSIHSFAVCVDSWFFGDSNWLKRKPGIVEDYFNNIGWNLCDWEIFIDCR